MRLHDYEFVSDTPKIIAAVDKRYKNLVFFRKGFDGRIHNKAYTKAFKKDILQPWDIEYYREYPEKLNTI